MNDTIINSQQSLDSYKIFLDTQFEKHHYLRVSMKTGQQRTGKQNNSLHKFCGDLAIELNSGGLDMRKFMKAGYPIPWTKETVMDNIWRPIQMALTGHKSTTKPLTSDYPMIYDALNVKLAEHGIYVPFPSRGEL